MSSARVVPAKGAEWSSTPVSPSATPKGGAGVPKAGPTVGPKGSLLGAELMSRSFFRSKSASVGDEPKISIWWTLDNVPMSKVQFPAPGQDEDVAASQAKLHWTMISPTSPFRVTWDVTVLMLLMYYVFAVPFRLCFMDTQKPDKSVCRNDYHMQSQSMCLERRGCQWLEASQMCDQEDMIMGLFIFDTAVDFFFMIDICLNFRTAFTIIDDRAAQRLVTDGRQIAWAYAKSWFLFDLAGSLPLDLVLYLLDSDEGALATTKVAARLPRFLRFAKILRFLKLARAARMSKVIDRIQEEVNIKPGVFRVVQFFTVFVMVAHVMACFLFWLGTMTDEFVCYQESALCPLEDVLPPDLPVGAPIKGITWITQTKIVSRLVGEVSVAEAPLDTQYLLSMYWAVTTMTTVGYGDIKPTTTYEVTACILTMLIGATTFSYVVGNMASLISKLDGLSGAFRERMDQATVFMHENNIPKDLKLRIRKYYDYSFNHPLVDVSGSMLKDLSPALHQEVVRYLRRDILAQVSLFQSLHNKQRRHLLSALQPKLIPMQHGPTDFIYHAGELGKCFYIIVAGEVDLVDAVTREVFATFRKGNYFGENALLPDEERRPFSARARSWCDILAMRVKDLEVVLHDFPAVAASIRLTARLRWARLMKAFEAHNVLVAARDRQVPLNGRTLLRVVCNIDENGEYTPLEDLRMSSFVDEGADGNRKSLLRLGKGRKEGKDGAGGAGREAEVENLPVEQQQALLEDLQRGVLNNEVGKQLAAGIRLSVRGGWDWSRDWVDGEDIVAESERLKQHYNGASLADKAVQKTVGDTTVNGWRNKYDYEADERDGEKNFELSADHITPGVELERALEKIIHRLDVIEAQTDMHEVVVQLRRLNQLSAERNALEKRAPRRRRSSLGDVPSVGPGQLGGMLKGQSAQALARQNSGKPRPEGQPAAAWEDKGVTGGSGEVLDFGGSAKSGGGETPRVDKRASFKSTPSKRHLGDGD